MNAITDEFMMSKMPTMKSYTAVLIKAGPNIGQPDIQPVIWEHARRNFALREEGLLSVVCPISIEADLKGICIFNTEYEQTRQIMEEDPGVKAGIFVFEVHPTRSFPGDSLPQ